MRRIPALLITLAVIVALVVVTRTRPDDEVPVFADVQQPWMPSVSQRPAPTNWFCPGVPAEGEGRGGEVVIANTTAGVLRGRYSVLAEDGEQVSERIIIEPGARLDIDVDETADSAYASVVVELDHGGGIVEQRAVDPDGDSLAGCSTTASAQWYLADGFTEDDSVNELVLSNPYDTDAVVNLGIVTDEGARTPGEYQGFPVRARSVAVIDVADLGAQSEPIVAASVTASRGRVVLGRAQQFAGRERGGFTMTLAAPAMSDQWWFTIGERTEGVIEEYRLFNPTESDLEVAAAVLGVPPSGAFSGLATIDVPAGEVTAFAAGEVEGLPEGQHAFVFSTVEQPGIIVERVLTRTGSQGRATSVSLGGLARPDGFVANNWYLGTSPLEETTDAITIYNTANSEAMVEVRTLGPGGFAIVRGLDRIRVPPGGVVSTDFIQERALGRTLLVSATTPVFVERQIPRDGPLGGPSTAWEITLDA